MWKNWNPCALLVQRWSGAISTENNTEVSQKIENRTTIWSSNLTSGYIPKRSESMVLQTYLHTHVHRSTIHNSKEIKVTHMSTNGWMNKENYTIEYYSALKEILPHATTWMNLEDITLSEISQSQKDQDCIIPFIWGT